MTLKDKLDDAVESIEEDAGKLRDIVQGDDTTVVSTANGNVSSVAKVLNEIETEAETYRDEAQTAKTAAETAQTAAETAETNAVSAKTAAETAQTAAETAQTAAETAETNAETAETNAVSAKTAAETAQTAAETAETNIDKKYLGSKSSAPTTDNDGGTLITGAQYFDTSSDTMKIWTGTAWATPVAISYNADDITTGTIDKDRLGDGSIAKAKLEQGSYLPTSIHTTTNGKFFTRNTDGSLPTNITAANVWSLTDQETNLGGTAPSGKNHIELPLKISGILAGAGGGGAAYYAGSDGGDTTFLGITAQGGKGGVSNGTGHTNLTDTLVNNSTIMSFSLNNRGGSSNNSGYSSVDTQGVHGYPGGQVFFRANLPAGTVYDFTVGDGGAGGSYLGGYNYGSGASGENGFITVNH
jgi:hypothetical protein|tara:strand:- start:456 stop:1694 length:1239 start_codon:yes stop_codon:yes gene_type:complete